MRLVKGSLPCATHTCKSTPLAVRTDPYPRKAAARVSFIFSGHIASRKRDLAALRTQRRVEPFFVDSTRMGRGRLEKLCHRRVCWELHARDLRRLPAAQRDGGMCSRNRRGRARAIVGYYRRLDLLRNHDFGSNGESTHDIPVTHLPPKVFQQGSDCDRPTSARQDRRELI